MLPRCFHYGAIACCLGIATLASAQTSNRPHLELVRGLRKENLPDLALQYLDELKAGNPPPTIAVLLPIEYARTWLDLAAEENDESKRNALISQARREIESFLKTNPNHELAPEANVELARLYFVQGKTQLRRAHRIDDPKEQEEELKAARQPLQTAADKYKATIGAIDAQIKKLEQDKSPAGEKRRRELVEFRLQANLDEAIANFYLGDTYTGDESKERIERGKKFADAAKFFQKIMIMPDFDKQPICWIARAWYANAMIKAGDESEGDRQYKDLLSRKNVPAAAAGIRVARYFMIMNNAVSSADDWRKLEKDTTEWLRDYRTFRDTYEGLGARYSLALAKYNLGALGVLRDKKDQVTGVTQMAKAQLEDAQRLFKELSEPENEFSERSNHRRSMILVTLADAEGRGEDPAPEALPSFERCYLMAQVQVARYVQFRKPAGRSPPSEAEIKKEEVRRIKNAMRYLDRALALANPAKDGVREVFAAQLFLVGCYSQLKMYPQAAVLAEHIARINPKLNKAASAGAAAVDAYYRSKIDVQKLKENAQFPAAQAEREKAEQEWDMKLKVDEERLLRVGEYAIKQWPTEAASYQTRFLLAQLELVDNRFEDAWKNLAAIHNGFPALQLARLQLASSMHKIVYPEEVKNPVEFKKLAKERIQEHAEQWKKTISLLDSVPMPGEIAGANEVLYFIDNRIQLTRLYELDEAYDKARQVGDALLKNLPNFAKLSDGQKLDQTLRVQAVVLGAVRAQAYDALRSGNHAQVAELLDRRIGEIKKDFDKPPAGDDNVMFQRLRKLQRDTVMLALQSCAQDGKSARAIELFELLNSKGASEDESAALLQTLVTSVRTQIEELEAAKKTAEANSLKEGFKSLFENMAANIDKLPVKTKLSVAQGMTSVGAYAKAAEILDAIHKSPPPAAPAEAETHTKYQRQAQILLARNYRSAKDYPAAMKAFDEMIGVITRKDPIPKKDKQGWAFGYLPIRKEKALMMEEMAQSAPNAQRSQKWTDAVQEWIAIASSFPASRQLLPPCIPLTPADEAKQVKKAFLQAFLKKRNPAMGGAVEADLACVVVEFAANYAKERDQARQTAEETGPKRAFYFELAFEQKRCSVLAYRSLGLSAYDGRPAGFDKQGALEQQFAKFAQYFHDLVSKNHDLSQSIKDRINELVASVPELKKEYDKVRAVNK